MERLSQLSKLGLFESSVPRYTSYPTSPQFNASVGAAEMAHWIDEIPDNSEISLYVHVPFCRHLCWFCACRTQGTRNLETVRSYLETLKTELRLLATRLAPGIRLSRLHLGGGTPTLMTPDMMKGLIAAIHDVAPMAGGGEFSVEIDPNEIDDARMDALADVGMTRASIGVQDFDPDIQRIIGRIQSFELTRTVTEGLRARGIESLNADILYGLPNQSRARIADSVQRLLALGPDRVALYGYAHVPWMARRQSLIPSELLPSPEERLNLFETARKLFHWDGYDEIGIDHFARPTDGLAEVARAGKLRRNFQGYTDDQSQVLIGLGASSISRFPKGYVQNAAGTGDYTKCVREGTFASARGHAFAGEDLLRARMIEALMCDFRISRKALCADLGVTEAQITQILTPAARTFAEFLEDDGDQFTITKAGRPLTRMIARALDAYDLSKAGHSSAV